MRARRRRSSTRFAALAVLLAALLFPALAGAAGKAPEPESQSRPAAEALARKYAPITMLREEQDPPCEKTAEQYEPTSVDTVLGNPTVTLTALVPGKGLVSVKKAPTAEDIAGLSGDYYLDLEGKALGDTCVYAKGFKKLLREGKAPAVAYAHIAREEGHSGFALQYWFFWYFNQFNDLHEGDWEGMQLSFEANSPKQALKEEPQEIIVFQHAGGERADWDSSKVQKQGFHPVVYPAAGSHATFYDSAVYVQNGQNGSGLGCDVTTSPLRELRPRPVLLPERVQRTGEFQWLSYYGRWGEREKGYNNGPQGPQTKASWREPFTWMGEQRTTSPQLPGGAIPGMGEPVAKAFCATVAAASELVNLDIKSRGALIATLVGAVLIIVLFLGLTRWRPIDLERLQARRTFGQLVRTSRQLYGRHWRVLVPVSVVAIPIVGITTWLAGLVGNVHTGDRTGSGGVNFEAGGLLEALARPAAMAVVSAVVVVLVRLLVEGEQRPGFRQCFNGMRSNFWRVVGAQMLYVLGLYALAITIVGAPFAVNKYVAWIFVKQEILFHDRRVRDAFHGSADLVRGRWWHTVRFAVFLFVLTTVAGPILTFALIFTNLPLVWVDLLGSLVFALLIPYVALGETLLYLDLQARAETEPAKPPRSWRPWRPRSFGRTKPEWSPLPGAAQPAPT